MRYTLFLSIFIILICAFEVSAKEIKIEVDELAKWRFWGNGLVAKDAGNKQVLLTEFPGSKGVMLVSPDVYGKDFVISYKVKPLTQESVLVVLLSVSDKGYGKKELNFPYDYNGNMGYLATETDGYFIAFHNAAHDRTPFIRKYSQELNGGKVLSSADKNIMKVETHSIEIGKVANSIWLKIDDKTVLKTIDKKMLDSGHIIFRIRGTKDRIAGCLIKDVMIDLVNEKK